MYKKHPLNSFFSAAEIKPDNLDTLDPEYIFYLIYRDTRSSVRIEDKDHIQPSSLLEEMGVRPQKINSIGNLQLIDSSSNRGRKNDKPLNLWIEEVENKREYIERHLIPDNPRLWEPRAFN